MITDKDKARAFRMLVEEAREDLWEQEEPSELPERARAGLETALATIRESTKAAAFRALVEEAKDDEPSTEELSPRAKAALAKAQRTIAENTVKPDNVVDIRSARTKMRWAAIGVVTGAIAAGVPLYATVNNLATTLAAYKAEAGPVSTGAGAPGDPATIYRGEAAMDYANGRFVACVTKLDNAKRLDPTGDADPEIVVLREKCIAGLKGDH